MVASLQYLYMLVINDDVPPPRRSDKPWIALPHQDTQRIKNFMFHFPQNLRLTNLTNFWQHSQIHMALRRFLETSKKAIRCFFNKKKFEIGNEMVVLRHFIIYVTILKNWILLFSHEKFSIAYSKLIRP